MTPSPWNAQSSRPSVEWLESLLWTGTDEDLRVYAAMDGNWCFELYGRLLQSDLSWAHLFHGGIALKGSANAPFVIALERGHAFTRWLVEDGWGKGWGIFFGASTKAARRRYGPMQKYPQFHEPTNKDRVKLSQSTGLEDPIWLVREHFRRFSSVEFENSGEMVNFRFYDPATLRTYMPTCGNYELSRFFGPVKYYVAEGFCEVASLNRPQDVYSFSAWFDTDASSASGPRTQINHPPMIFEGDCFDMQTGKQTEIERSPVAFEEVERKNSGLWLMRKGQAKEFEKRKDKCFTEKTCNFIQKHYETKSSQTDLRKFIEKEKMDAERYGFHTEINALNFIICAYLHGDQFKADLEVRPQKARPDFDKDLHALANSTVKQNG